MRLICTIGVGLFFCSSHTAIAESKGSVPCALVCVEGELDVVNCTCKKMLILHLELAHVHWFAIIRMRP